MKRKNYLRTLSLLLPLLALNLFILTRHVRSAGDSIQGNDLTFDKVVQPFFANNCYSCHNEEKHTARLNLELFDSAASLTKDRTMMTLILNKLKSGQMPPPEQPRPRPEDIAAVTSWLARQLGASGVQSAPAEQSSASRVTVRRLNRVEYDNTVRDLLGVDLHLSENFPQDDSGYGFDNIAAVLSLSPVLMEKYLAAAEKISRAAVFGIPPMKPTLVRLHSGERNQIPQLTVPANYDLTGLSLPNAIHTKYRVPVDGDYVIRATLGGERPAGSEAMQLALWIDGKLVKTISTDPANLASFAFPGEPQQLWGIKEEFKVQLPSGDHLIAVAIPHLYEGLPAAYNGPNPSKRPIPPRRPFKPPPDLTPKEIEEHRKEYEKKATEKIPANGARIGSLELGGPYTAATGPSIESQKKVYVCGHLNGHHNRSCGQAIVQNLARHAFRRPVAKSEVLALTKLIAQTQQDGGSFEEGLAVAIQAMLVSPRFLFRVEDSPLTSGALSQYDLASRLSYFLWSSMPDDALLQAADRGTLNRPSVLDAQVRRMLLDEKADALVQNFGGQWLQVRKLESVKPDNKKYVDFDEYLRLSMARETELFFESIMREDRSILDFIDCDYTYLNERLARFYGVADIQGPDFRKVLFSKDAHRGGLLGQASVLTISSYANRTSPVLRGKWVLENLVGSPPPPPPPDVPNLDEAKIGKTSSMREQLELHRTNAVCASCHSRMDPLGFGLENFDAIGAWREKDGQFTINASGVLPDGRSFDGAQGLKSILKAQPDAFAETLTRKLLIYALGRGLEAQDDAAVKQIVSQTKANNYRFSSLILGVVKSEAFQKQRANKLSAD